MFNWNQKKLHGGSGVWVKYWKADRTAMGPGKLRSEEIGSNLQEPSHGEVEGQRTLRERHVPSVHFPILFTPKTGFFSSNFLVFAWSWFRWVEMSSMAGRRANKWKISEARKHTNATTVNTLHSQLAIRVGVAQKGAHQTMRCPTLFFFFLIKKEKCHDPEDRG